MSNTPKHQEHSETALINEVFKLTDAGGSVIQIRTREIVRTSLTLRKAILAEDSLYSYTEWDVVNGTRRFTLENYANNVTKGNDSQFFDALMEPLVSLRDSKSPLMTDLDKVHFFVYVDAQNYINGNPIVTTLLQQYAAMLPALNACLVFITPDIDFHELPMGTILIADMPTPNAEELASSLTAIIGNSASDGDWLDDHQIEEEDIDRIALLGLGMTRFEFETHASLAIVEQSIANDPCIDADKLMRGIAKGKTEVVKQSDILELFPSESMDDVGGMQRLKDWVDDRALTFSPEAREFGAVPPKGVAIIGVPGAGKSLIAKAIAGGWGVPLIRLDFGRVFAKYVGESESRMRQALNMVSRMGRLVLFADEIDKGLGGIGGGGDSGISSRVLGAFLTWMQENESEVFVIMTANRIEGLPPELFRRGRLDAVFSVGLPTPEEREQVLAVHLRKRGRDIADFDAVEIKAFRTASHNYLPAEIESAVKDALIIAFNEPKVMKNKKMTMDHIIQALAAMVPMSKSHKEQIDKIIAWSADNATPVNYDPVAEVVDAPSDNAPRRAAMARRRPPTQH